MIDFNKIIKEAMNEEVVEFTEPQLNLLVSGAKIDLLKKYVKPETLVSFIEENNSEIEVLTPQNISMTIGMAKSKKTYFSSMVAASLLGCKDFAIKGNLNNRDLIYIDTEQAPYHASRVAYRIKKLANCDIKQIHYFILRGHEPETIMAIICHILKTRNVGLMILDGLIDCVYSMNDEKECKKVVLKLMKYSLDFNCHINGILHTGKDNQNPLGHLGSFMVRKAETVFRTQKFNDNGETEIIAEMTRNKQFKSWIFRVNKEGIPVRDELPTGFFSTENIPSIEYANQRIEASHEFDSTPDDLPF